MAVLLSGDWINLWVLAIVAIGGLVFAVVAVFLTIKVRRLERRMVGLVAVGRDLKAENDRQRQVTERLTDMLNRHVERLGQLELRAASRPYEQAIQMASAGGSEDGLVRYFGLTEGEAALVRLLHGRKDDVPGAGAAEALSKVDR